MPWLHAPGARDVTTCKAPITRELRTSQNPSCWTTKIKPHAPRFLASWEERKEPKRPRFKVYLTHESLQTCVHQELP